MTADTLRPCRIRRGDRKASIHSQTLGPKYAVLIEERIVRTETLTGAIDAAFAAVSR